MIDFTLPDEAPNPLAGSVEQIFHSPSSIWICRRTDSHEISVENGEIIQTLPFERFIENSQKRFSRQRRASYWLSPDRTVLVRLRQAPNSRARLTCHHTTSGAMLWESEIQIQPSASNDQTDIGPLSPELFLAAGTSDPALCAYYPPEDDRGLIVHQLSKIDGAVQWSLDINDAKLNIIARAKFDGLLRTSNTVGRIDFDSGKVLQTDPLPGYPSQPIRIDERIYFSTHSSSDATLLSMDGQCSNINQVIRVGQKRVSETQVYAAASQPVMRVNQNAIWFKNTNGKDTQIKFKPWVYGVAASEGGPLFVMTDGNGGRLMAFDRSNANQLLDIKPKVGGYGMHAFLDNHDLIITSEATKRDWSQRALRIVSTEDCKHTLHPIGGLLLSAQFDHAVIQDRNSQDPNSFTLLELRQAHALL